MFPKICLYFIQQSFRTGNTNEVQYLISEEKHRNKTKLYKLLIFTKVTLLWKLYHKIIKYKIINLNFVCRLLVQCCKKTLFNRISYE